MIPLLNPRTFGLLPKLVSPDLRSRLHSGAGMCEICGVSSTFTFARIIPDDLARTACLTEKIREMWDRRESMACSKCGARFRGRQTARALVQLYGGHRCFSLHQLLDQHSFRSLRILVMADTNIDALKPHPNCQFSDYYLSLIPATGREDNGLEAADASLDLVITSDIIEHTPYYVHAMEEFRRALKPGGIWLAILPLMPERLTRTRAVVDGDGNVWHLMEESHHLRGRTDSLVFVEFGSDFVRTMEGVGFQVRIFYFSLFEFDYTSVFVSTKLLA
jgi:hypothetical protein